MMFPPTSQVFFPDEDLVRPRTTAEIGCLLLYPDIDRRHEIQPRAVRVVSDALPDLQVTPARCFWMGEPGIPALIFMTGVVYRSCGPEYHAYRIQRVIKRVFGMRKVEVLPTHHSLLTIPR